MSAGQAQPRIAALHAILRDAAQDGFAELERGAAELGSRLRVAADRVVSVLATGQSALVAWRAELTEFEGLERDTQVVVVARGLRLCFGLGGGGDAAGRPSVSGSVSAGAVGDEAGEGRAVLAASAESLPGIGPAMAARLGERGLRTVEDLVWFVPRRYDDARRVEPLSDALAAADTGEARALRGEVASARFVRNGRRRWVEVRLVEGRPAEAASTASAARDPGDPPIASTAAPSRSAAQVVVRWFHAHPGMTSRFPRGSQIVLSGRLSRRGGVAEMANPDVLEVETPDGLARRAPGRILPRYAEVPGVPPATVRRTCAAAVDRGLGLVDDGVPAEVEARQGLPSLAEALAALHRPADSLPDELVDALVEGDSRWHRRLAFGDLFLLGVAVAQRRRERCADRAVPCRADVRGELERALPFRLTGAQRRAIDAISADLARDVPMSRLLQGDVGAGKTAVALAAAHQVVASGRQVALMAPTEILAEQHLAALAPLCRALGLRAALVTAATPRPARASTAEQLAAGTIDLVIGTHALLGEDLGFRALGLAIIDEQHRFGVAQRVRLRGKGDERGAPHLLVMTATPIPRTLALSAYGDLDLTLLDELPPGRQPIRTRVLRGAPGRREARDALADALAGAGRAFVVCPLVAPPVPDDDEEPDPHPPTDAITRAAELAADLGRRAVGLVHGRMNQAERDGAMLSFRDGDTRILVATTVIEVGIDVPEATLMVVEDADRFGLAQLHQLRGRVGRGGGESECLLVTRPGRTAAAERRLVTMEETGDGFRIAEVDLEMRGPGELLGVRQAGLPRLRFGDLVQHVELLARARDEAERLIESDPDLSRPEHAALRRVLAERMAEIEAYGAESG
ncbi:MAG TPA: ATP-dependent DNA helicase RecG [Kofleriaceae bacterium]|nr:ATP-dependent DNA helicase RecG [Kofleriaceae bacterium]